MTSAGIPLTTFSLAGSTTLASHISNSTYSLLFILHRFILFTHLTLVPHSRSSSSSLRSPTHSAQMTLFAPLTTSPYSLHSPYSLTSPCSLNSPCSLQSSRRTILTLLALKLFTHSTRTNFTSPYSIQLAQPKASCW